MTDEQTFTNTGLATARRCLTEFDLRYNQRLESDAVDSEALQVGQAWHKAHDADHVVDSGSPVHLAPYRALKRYAPSDLWNEKLRRLFAAAEWYWRDQPLGIVETERTFRAELAGVTFEGQIDGVLELPDGRRGILERKTTASSLDSESDYWERLRLDVQIGLYSAAVDFVPDFIVYDVVRKPSINPKRLTKADVKRLTAELAANDGAVYFAEVFTAAQLAGPLEEGRESIELYGARLTADIGDRPGTYFARREVTRSPADMLSLFDNLTAQVKVIEHAQREAIMHRNADACNAFGRCTFFGLCSNNIRPTVGDSAPDGFHVREHLHPELAPSTD